MSEGSGDAELSALLSGGMGADSSAARVELRRSEERFRVALAHSGVVAFEHDGELRYTWIYPTQFYAVAEVIGKTDVELFGAEDGERLMALKRRVLTTGAPLREEVQVSRNGRRHEFVLTVAPIDDGRGNIVGLTGASTNITAAKEVQRQLASALEFRDRIMGILGHDLRNPLSAIQGWTQRLLGAEPCEDKRRPLLRIERSVRRMAEMIGTLLDFADTRFNDRLPMSPVPTNLADVLRGVIEELQAANPGRQIQWLVEGAPRGMWDPARLAQVASNLIANALTHGAETGAVGVKLRAETATVVLEVSNAGPPIPEPRIPDLFKPFQPGHVADGGSAGSDFGQTTRRGLGLGLYIADQIVRAHGGSIAVASTREHGTVFSVSLPRNLQPENPNDPPGSTRS